MWCCPAGAQGPCSFLTILSWCHKCQAATCSEGQGCCRSGHRGQRGVNGDRSSCVQLFSQNGSVDRRFSSKVNGKKEKQHPACPTNTRGMAILIPNCFGLQVESRSGFDVQQRRGKRHPENFCMALETQPGQDQYQPTRMGSSHPLARYIIWS